MLVFVLLFYKKCVYCEWHLDLFSTKIVQTTYIQAFLIMSTFLYNSDIVELLYGSNGM